LCFQNVGEDFEGGKLLVKATPTKAKNFSECFNRKIGAFNMLASVSKIK
jgi:hypothetical protein